METLHCRECGRVLLEYAPPLVIVIRCRRCGAWQHVTIPPPARAEPERGND